MRTNHVLEIAVESAATALAAESAGASRVELCSNLQLGGVTPNLNLIRATRDAVKLPIYVMIRPRAGDFVYSDAEFLAMADSIRTSKDSGMDGLVLGILTPSRQVDVARVSQLIELAAPLPVTFHRAFDATANVQQSLLEVLHTGARRILSSGGAANALGGASTLAKLRQAAAGRIAIMPGAGIDSSNIAEVARISGAHELHSGLGNILRYGSQDYSAFEAEVRKMIEALGRNPHPR